MAETRRWVPELELDERAHRVRTYDILNELEGEVAENRAGIAALNAKLWGLILLCIGILGGVVAQLVVR